ncbi:hypothetical protein TNCV_3824251 [Trichonephila clavipes]|nr:hypothetical protein TNCV_3824251 [Trichonephila clavipes]
MSHLSESNAGQKRRIVAMYFTCVVFCNTWTYVILVPFVVHPTHRCCVEPQKRRMIAGQQFTIDALKASGIYDPDNPYVKELLNSLYMFTDLHHQVVSEFSSLSPCNINGCPHYGTENNCNNYINMETEKYLPSEHEGFTMPPSSKISKFNDNQPNFQIQLANRFNVLSQELAENLTTDSASTTIQNTVSAPLPNENTLNAPTPNQNTLNTPNPNYVPPPVMLKVTDTYKQQMKIITNKLLCGVNSGEYLKLHANTNGLQHSVFSYTS